jgi:Xaa-Pro aminopeptidase
MNDIIWIGRQKTLQSLAEAVGINSTKSPSELKNALNVNTLKYLPPYRSDSKLLLSELLTVSPSNLKPSVELIKAVIAQRELKSEEEIQEMTIAVNITREMHLAAIKAVKPNKMEYEVVAKIMETMHHHHAELSYPVIFSVHGQTLHNHYHGNKMIEGQIAINDSGCENEMMYAGDITRTIPVSGKFSSKQKEIYDTVLEMEEKAIASLKSGLAYKEVHISANRILLNNLKSIGLVNGDIDEMLNQGVGGLFMPHGLGHQIGLDVHDMEDLGENFVGYAEGQERSTQLGLKSLRMAKKLEIGHVITVEPGCYFIPELIQKYKSEGIFAEFVNYAKLEEYYNFGGIRLEDNVMITKNGYQVLGNPIPKTVEELEMIMS